MFMQLTHAATKEAGLFNLHPSVLIAVTDANFDDDTTGSQLTYVGGVKLFVREPRARIWRALSARGQMIGGTE